MQENHNQSDIITDLELAKRYGTDKIGVEVKEIELGIELDDIKLRLPNWLGFSVKRIKAQAQGRGLYLTIAVIGLTTLLNAISSFIR